MGSDATDPPEMMKDTSTSMASERQRAFEELTSDHVAVLHRTAIRVLKSEDLAWDAVQETLIRAWSYPDLPQTPRRLLLSILRQSCLHILRCSRRRSDHEFAAARDQATRCCPMDPEAAATDPAASAAERDEVRHITKVASRLTREHREILELVVWQGLSYQKVADALSLPIGTVRSRTSRARTALTRFLSEDAPEAEAC